MDRVWGIGLAADDEAAEDPERWRGPNLLGFALMEARERLQGSPDQYCCATGSRPRSYVPSGCVIGLMAGLR